MSQAALDYVRDSAAVKALPAAEKMVLEKLAMLHRLEVNCAFAPVADLARLCLIGGKDAQRQCRRILERLEKKGFILRHRSIRNNGSHTSNEYELLGLRAGTAVTEQMRQQVFTTPRTRVAAQLSLSLDGGELAGGTECNTNGSESSAVVSEVDGANGSSGSAVAAEVPNGSESSAVGLVVQKDDEVSAHPRTPMCPPPPGQPRVSALDVVLEARNELELPLPPLSVPECGKSKNADQRQERKATASAKATATTPVLRAPGASIERVGESGLSSAAARVIPFRGRRLDAEQERAQLDGFEAALFDVTMVVLCECGIARANATRRQRLAVSEALREKALRSGESLSALGALAVNRWNLYLESAWALSRVVGVRQFFAEGYWLEKAGHPWDWNYAAIRERRGSGIGMR